MKTLWRPHTSPYFPAEFNHWEKELALEFGLDYHSGPLSKDLAQSSSDLIVITNTHVRCVSDMIVSHLYHHFSPLHDQEKWDVTRNYERKLISELRILVLGHGHIGKILEKTLRPVCKKLSIVDPLKKMHDETEGFDVVIPVPSLSKTSRGMIDFNFLEKQKSDVVMINCSRGRVVNFSDLTSFLKKKSKAYAYQDVFENEPFNFEEHHIPNLKMTSHVAGVFSRLPKVTLDFEKHIIGHFLEKSRDEFLDYFKDLHLQKRSPLEFL